MHSLWSLLYIILIVPGGIMGENSKCGYSSCDPGKPGVLNVHLIPHTHDDVGWLKTVDQYYYGYRDNIQGAGVQYVLDTVVQALNDNPNRRFSYVEMAYFTRWWNNQNQATKSLVHKLVNEGRLQFLLGGWSMNDEADTHYTASIDQMTLGLDFLNQTFGDCGRPLIAWQIDPFGHSKEQSNLFHLMGFDGNIFMRIDYRDKQQRMQQKRMEFFQKTNINSKSNNNLFTNVMYDTYCPPGSFCFDDKCQDAPIMDDPTLHDYNVFKRIHDFVDYALGQSKVYTTNHILVPMGCDFQFQNAYHNFVNLDKLIHYANLLRKDVNVMYSTPACYVKAVNRAKKMYTYKDDDFFPYASGPNNFWTGYFTSRSALKGFVRKANNLYQASKQALLISNMNQTTLNKKIQFMGAKMGVLQHHDAVTGTEKQEVAYDYAQRLYNGWTASQEVLSSSLSTLMTKDASALKFELCSLSNISICLPSDNMQYSKPLTVVTYNSLTSVSTEWYRIPVSVVAGDAYLVKDSSGKVIPSQLVMITERTRSIPERPKNLSANFELIFNVKTPAIGYSSYTISREKASSRKRPFEAEVSSVKSIFGEAFSLKNKHLLLYFKDNLLASMVNLDALIAVNVSQKLQYYFSQQGAGQSSGAYIFRPTTKEPVPFKDPVKITLIKGSLVTEVHQVFSDWATLVTRLYNDSDKVESEWTVGPIPVTNPSVGREVVLDYITDLNNRQTFYTDSNSRQLLIRMIDQRFSYNFTQTEAVSGNYYPLNSDISIIDDSRNPMVAFIIHTDRALGGGAYKNGMLEVMLHRRTLADDNFGVGEALNELGADGKGLIVRGKQWFTIGKVGEIIKDRRIENLKLFNKPVILFSKDLIKRNLSLTVVKEFSALRTDLPRHVHITSLENHFNLDNEIDYQIVRLENLYEFNGEPTVVDLNKIFNLIIVTSIEELNLSANQYIKNVNRLKWNFEKGKDKSKRKEKTGTIISLLPNEIRTFKVTLQRK